MGKNTKWRKDPQIWSNIGLGLLGISLSVYSVSVSLPIWLSMMVGSTSVYYIVKVWLRRRALITLKKSNAEAGQAEFLSQNVENKLDVPVVHARKNSHAEVHLLDTTYRYGRSNPPPSQEEQDARWESERDSRGW